MGRWRVSLGFLVGALFAVFSHVASGPRLAVGLALAFLGLGLRAWAAGYLEKGKRLAQDGPYAWMRHPLYVGSFGMALGFAVAGTGGGPRWHDAIVWAAFLFLFFGVYPRRIREEEGSLEKYFGDAWRTFVQARPRFLPRFSPLRRSEPDHFLWPRYLKNGEYNAFVGWLAGVLFLILKARWELRF